MKLGTYYYEINDRIRERYPDEFTSKYYYITIHKDTNYKSLRLDAKLGLLRLKMSRCSDRVWRQGPKGGVKLVKDKFGANFQYVTNDEKMMEQFMWVKLKSKELL